MEVCESVRSAGVAWGVVWHEFGLLWTHLFNKVRAPAEITEQDGRMNSARPRAEGGFGGTTSIIDYLHETG